MSKITLKSTPIVTIFWHIFFCLLLFLLFIYMLCLQLSLNCDILALLYTTIWLRVATLIKAMIKYIPSRLFWPRVRRFWAWLKIFALRTRIICRIKPYQSF